MKAKLGVYIPMYGGWLRGVDEGEREASWSYAADVALRAEELGIPSVWVTDHMLNMTQGERARCLEAWTTLTALAAITKRVELCHITLCAAFRYPAVLAKMCATLDGISEGRFKFVHGAGWMKREYEAYGLQWYDHDTRIDMAREQIEIVKALWTQPTVNYKGRFYEIVDGILEPKPVQKPHPPIWWGGTSEKSRELTADLCDGWLPNVCTIQEAEGKMEDMRRRLDQRGRKDIQYGVDGWVFMGRTDDEAVRQLKAVVGGNPELLDNILKRGFVGSPETIADRIGKLVDLGVDYIILEISPALKVLEEVGEHILPIL